MTGTLIRTTRSLKILPKQVNGFLLRKELSPWFTCRDVFIGLTLSHDVSREKLPQSFKGKSLDRGLRRKENGTICLDFNEIRIGEEHTTKSL